MNPKLNYLKDYEKNDASKTLYSNKLNSNSKAKISKKNNKEQQHEENENIQENSRSKINFKEKTNPEKSSTKTIKPKNPHPKTPKNFYSQFQLIKEMRDRARAPVDDMGVECTIESNTDRPTYKFQTLVSLVLSAQTNDKTTFTVMKRLLDFGLSVDSIAEISEADLVKLIYEVNFHNNKARSLINVMFYFLFIFLLMLI